MLNCACLVVLAAATRVPLSVRERGEVHVYSSCFEVWLESIEQLLQTAACNAQLIHAYLPGESQRVFVPHQARDRQQSREVRLHMGQVRVAIRDGAHGDRDGGSSIRSKRDQRGTAADFD